MIDSYYYYYYCHYHCNTSESKEETLSPTIVMDEVFHNRSISKWVSK